MESLLRTSGLALLSVLPLLGCSEAKEFYDEHVELYSIAPKAFEVDLTSGTIVSRKAPSAIRAESDVVVAGGKIHVFGGYDEQVYLTHAVESYDPATDTWTSGAPWSDVRLNADSEAIGDEVYFSPGLKNVDVRDWLSVFDRYDASTNTWDTLGSIPGNFATGELSVHEGALYVLGGNDEAESEPASTAFRYDNALNTWVPLANLPFACDPYKSATIDHTIYIVGCSNFDAQNRGFLAYDVTADSWSLPPQPPVELPQLYANRVWVHQSSFFFYDWEPRVLRSYDTATQQWSTSAVIPEVRDTRNVATALVNDQFYVAVTSDKGESGEGAIMFKVFRYDIPTGAWELFAEHTPSAFLLIRPAVVGDRLFFVGAERSSDPTLK